MQPWVYIPFKGCQEGLEGYKASWNFIQSFTHTCAKHAFKILKRKRKVTMINDDAPLWLI